MGQLERGEAAATGSTVRIFGDERVSDEKSRLAAGVEQRQGQGKRDSAAAAAEGILSISDDKEMSGEEGESPRDLRDGQQQGSEDTAAAPRGEELSRRGDGTAAGSKSSSSISGESSSDRCSEVGEVDAQGLRWEDAEAEGLGVEGVWCEPPPRNRGLRESPEKGALFGALHPSGKATTGTPFSGADLARIGAEPDFDRNGGEGLFTSEAVEPLVALGDFEAQALDLQLQSVNTEPSCAARIEAEMGCCGRKEMEIFYI